MNKIYTGNKVVVIQRIVPDCREAFFRKLNEELTTHGIELVLLEGKALPNESLVSAGKYLSFVKQCRTIYLLGGIYWITGITSVYRSADVVIIEQAISGLHLYWCFFLRFLRNIFAYRKRRKLKIILWGHGITISDKTFMLSLRKKWKQLWTKLADCCFAYTDISAKLFTEMGIPSNKIKIIRNTLDINQIRKIHYELSLAELHCLKTKLFGQCDDTDRILTGIFCGRLTRGKNIPFLLEAITLIQQKMSNFRMIIIGNGEYAAYVQDFCSRKKWCVWTGAIHGNERVRYMAIADVWLHPGATGLAIVDSFAMGIPFITTKNELHGPEISYLKHFYNGIISPADAKQYADMIVYLLQNPHLLSALKQNALATGDTLTISEMVHNFCDGIYMTLNG